MTKQIKLNSLLGLSLAAMCSVNASAAEPANVPVAPTSPDGSVAVSLFAAEPDVVTPIGAATDAKGRLYVVESNTHFRTKKYNGPEHDQIRIFEDTKGAGHADKISTFWEGMEYVMHIAIDSDGSVVVSSRNEIFRLANRDGVAGEKTSLARLKTEANYPHNGLHGLAVDKGGNIYFGLGENLGGKYELIGNDGKSLTDDKGSGCVFRMDSKGNGITRLSRGFWNPFGVGVDVAGNIWAVDNDPDGRPPCRLVPIVPGADFGYEFRYGRTGLHPLQCWDGELPGTLGMTAGVGEAPCAVIWARGTLMVSSWRDHHVDAFTLTPRGATYTADVKPVVIGGENFRPVGLAMTPDGSLFVTDWASKSYQVNGLGRIWKLTFKNPAPTGVDLKPTPAMARAAKLRESNDVTELLTGMDDTDPATAQAAQYGLSRLAESEKIEWASLKSPRQRIGLLASLVNRGASVERLVGAALSDPDDRVRQMGVRAVSDQNIASAKGALETLMHADSLSPRLLAMTAAALGQLEGDKSAKVDQKKIDAVLLARLDNPAATPASLASALRMMLVSHPAIALDRLRGYLATNDAELQLQAVRYLNADKPADAGATLAEATANEKLPANVRAEATLGLGNDSAAHVELLLKLATSSEPVVRAEALRSLRPIGGTLSADQKKTLDAARRTPADSDLVDRVLGKVPVQRPTDNNVEAWQKVVDNGTGDPDAGRRIFFHPASAGCFKCHMIEGRGRAIGPDLTMIGHSQTREHVVESIIDPSKEIAPLYMMWTITTNTGQRVDGMLLRRDGQANEVYVDASGVETKVKEPTVTNRQMRKESLMPAGLVNSLTDQELRDVAAFLMQKR